VFERFTGRAREVMALAQAESARLAHDYVGLEQVLAGLASQVDTQAAAILRDAGLQDPLGTRLSRRARWLRSLGLQPDGPSPVRLLAEHAGQQLEPLRARVLTGLRDAA
jgi:ATP-dependent Clp protease ATP-binding subunit ClpA